LTIERRKEGESGIVNGKDWKKILENWKGED